MISNYNQYHHLKMNSNQNFKVRKARLSDIEFIHQVISTLSESNIRLNEFEAILKAKLKATGYYIYLLEEHSKTIENTGLLVVNVNQSLTDFWPIVEVQDFFIIPKYRKFGAADFLYNFLENFAKEQKAYRLKVSCKINSTLNQNFYTTRGFKISKKQYIKPVY